MTLAHITDHVKQGQALPIYDLRQPRFEALLATYLTQIQLLEDALWNTYIGTMLPAAAGDALDMIGDLVGEPRNGRTDDVYRLWITARVRLLHSSGRAPDLLAIARAVVPATVSPHLLEFYPGSITLDLVGALDATSASQLGAMFRQAKAAGVRIDTISSETSPDSVLTFGAAADAPQTDVQRGLSDVTQLTGGVFAHVS